MCKRLAPPPFGPPAGLPRAMAQGFRPLSPVTHSSVLFDHLVGADEERLRYGQPERLGGLEVGHKLDFGRLW
jgi:hypothetical protein